MKKIALLLILLIAPVNASAFNAEESFLKDFPGTAWRYFGQSDIGGVYEVLAGDNLLYYHPGTASLFFGEIWRQGKSVSQQRKNDIEKTLAAGSKHSKAVRVGSGSNIVIEISNPECPYCQMAHQYFADRNVTRYIYLYDPKMSGETALMQSILCSKDPAYAIERAYSGLEVIPDKDGKCNAGIRLDEHFRFALKSGVMVTPTFFVNGERVDGYNKARLDALLKP